MASHLTNPRPASLEHPRRGPDPRKLTDPNVVRIELEILESRAKPSKITRFAYVDELVVA
jgi:hypothetical protein